MATVLRLRAWLPLTIQTQAVTNKFFIRNTIF